MKVISDNKTNPNVQKKESYACAYCNKEFSQKSNKYRHQTHYCKMKPTEDISPSTSNTSMNKNGVDLREEIKAEMREEIATVMTDVIKTLVQKGSLVNQNHIHTQNNTNIQHQTINNINIYLTEKIDFVQALRDIYGWDEARAINHIKNRISQGDGGDVELFCDIYLVKDMENWPLIFKDRKTLHFLLKDANNNYIQDPGGVKLHDNFRSNYMDTLLRLSSREINNVLSAKKDPDFEFKRDYLMDHFDLQAVQNKAFKLCCKDGDGHGRQIFIRKLSDRIDIIQRQQSTVTVL